MVPSFPSTLGSDKKDDDKEDDSPRSRFATFSASNLPLMPKIPNVSQAIEATHVAEAKSSVTHRISEASHASEVAKEAASEVISTVTSFFGKNKNDVTTAYQAPNILSVNSQLPGLSHTSELISTTDLPSNTIKKNDSTFSQAHDVLSSITSQNPQLIEVTNPSKVVSSSTSLLSTVKNDNSTLFKIPNVLSSVIPNTPNVSEIPTASKAELTSDSSVGKSKKDDTSQFQVPSVLSSVTSRIPKVPVVPNNSELISTAASLIGTSMEYDNTQSLLAQCSVPDLSKIPQKSEVASSVTSQITHVTKVAPSLATSIGALNEVNNTQSLLPTFSQPQFLQMPKVPQVPQISQIPKGLVVPQFPDVVTSSTPLLGASGIPKDAAISFLKQILTQYLTSQTQQKAVVGLVLLNLARSLIGISISFIENHNGGYLDNFSFIFEGIRSLLGMLGFMISNAFVLEQVINFWTFGWRNHLASPYNVVDSFVTVITFASSLLPNTINEFASLLAILRLWRLFKRVGSIIPNLNPTRFLPNSYV